MKKKTILFAGACVVSAALLLLAWELPGKEPVRDQFFAMDTFMDLTAYGRYAEPALNEMEESIRQTDAEFSRTDENSIVSKINTSEGAPVAVDSELYGLLLTAVNDRKLTNGRFDITVAPISDLWGFTKDSFRIPEAEEIERALQYVGTEHLHFENGSISADAGTEIDLGGIAKGYMAEKAKGIFEKYGVKSGIANLGGDILVLGSRPDHTPWKVAVQDPHSAEGETGVLGTVSAENAYILTSGNYQRYFDENGVRYHHIIDPATGAPSASDLDSVTIVTEAGKGMGILSDVLSTALFIMGEEGAVRYWQDSSIPFDMVLVTHDNRVILTDGLKGRFMPFEDTSYEFQYIS